VTRHPSITGAQCVIVGYFPIGSTVDVSEDLDHSPGAPGEFIDTTGEGTVTMAAGINTITITNTARGLLEICKVRVAGIDTQPTFQFRVDGGNMVNVRGGTCSQPTRVSVGNHTVSEVANTNYDVAAITTLPSGALVSSSTTTRTATVSVAYAQDTTVFFTNRIRVGNVKVCKLVTPGSTDALNGKTFYYDVYVAGNAAVRVAVTPGSCTFAADGNGTPIDYPVLQPNGSNTPVAVVELGAYNTLAPPPAGSFYVTGIGVTGYRAGMTPETNCASVTYSPTGKHCILLTTAPAGVVHVRWQLGPNVNAVTFTNTAGDD
jgi:hypothetical protein